MVIYRPHRGALYDSLAEAKEFNSFDELKEYLIEHYKSLVPGIVPFEADDIVIDDEYMCDDDRCGWHDTRHVCVKRLFEEDYMEMYNAPQCIGFCAIDYEKLTPDEVNERIKNMR